MKNILLENLTIRVVPQSPSSSIFPLIRRRPSRQSQLQRSLKRSKSNGSSLATVNLITNVAPSHSCGTRVVIFDILRLTRVEHQRLEAPPKSETQIIHGLSNAFSLESIAKLIKAITNDVFGADLYLLG